MLLLVEVDGRMTDLVAHLDLDVDEFWRSEDGSRYREELGRSNEETVLDELVTHLWLLQSALPGWPDRPP